MNEQESRVFPFSKGGSERPTETTTTEYGFLQDRFVVGSPPKTNVQNFVVLLRGLLLRLGLWTGVPPDDFTIPAGTRLRDSGV